MTSALAGFVRMDNTVDVDPAVRVLGDDARVKALVASAQAGDRDAFADLVNLNYRAVYRTALAALGAREDAEDATQDAFVVAWRKIGGFRGEASFRTWLLTIVWRKAIDRRRVRVTWWRRIQQSGSDDLRDPLDSLESLGPDPEQHAESRQFLKIVQAHVQRLSPKLRDTLVLASSGEHSYAEIASVLGIPLGTVKWRVAEARRLLSESVPTRTES